MTASEIRALFAVANRPEVVSLADGMPYLPAPPLDAIAQPSSQLVTEKDDVAPAVRFRARRGGPA